MNPERLAVYSDPEQPLRLWVVLDDGDGGIRELDFSRFEHGDDTDTVPNRAVEIAAVAADTTPMPLLITFDQLTDWIGEDDPSPDELALLREAIPNSSVPTAVGDIFFGIVDDEQP